MMLALVKCLFWIIKRAAESELVLAHLSFSLFTSESLLLFFSCMKPVIQPIFFGNSKGNGNSNEQQCETDYLFKNTLRCVLSTKCDSVMEAVNLGNFLVSRYALWTFFAVKVMFNCANHRHILMSLVLMNDLLNPVFSEVFTLDDQASQRSDDSSFIFFVIHITVIFLPCALISKGFICISSNCTFLYLNLRHRLLES